MRPSISQIAFAALLTQPGCSQRPPPARPETGAIQALLDAETPPSLVESEFAGPVVVKRERGERAAAATVRQFLDAIAAESLMAMGGLVTKEATIHVPGKSTGSLLGRWAQRFAKHNLSPLGESLRFGPTFLRTATADRWASMPDQSPPTMTPAPEDVLVQVTLTLPSTVHDVMGSQLEFWLTPEADTLKVKSVVESY